MVNLYRFCIAILFASLSFSYAQMCSVSSCEESTGFSCFQNDSIIYSKTIDPSSADKTVEELQRMIRSSNTGYRNIEYTGFQISADSLLYCARIDWRDGRITTPCASAGKVTDSTYKNVEFCSLQKPVEPQQCTIVDISNVDGILADALLNAYKDPSNATCSVDPMYDNDGNWVGYYGLQCQDPNGALSYASTVSLPTFQGTGEQCNDLPNPPPPPIVEKPPVDPDPPVDPTDPTDPPTDPTDPPEGGGDGDGDGSGEGDGNGNGNGSGNGDGNGGGSGSNDGLTQNEVRDAVKDALDLKHSEIESNLSSLSDRLQSEMISEANKLERETNSMLDDIFGSLIVERNVEDFEKEYIFQIDAPKICPEPYILDFGKFQIPIPFDIFCQFAEIIGYLVIASAYMSAIYIVLGLRR